MKIVQLQYSNKSAGSSALRLQEALIEFGIDSSIISFKSDHVSNPKIKYLGIKSKLISWLDEKYQNIINARTHQEFGLFSYPFFGTDVSSMDDVKNADVIYLHWTLMGFLNFRCLKKLSKLKKPLIIIMHDMWYLTGGCHYSFDCIKYTYGCHNCQVLKSNKRDDLSNRGYQKKIRMFSKFKNFYFVSPSKWLFNCAKNSPIISNNPLFYIPNIIDNTKFKPFDVNTAKKILGINQDEVVIAFGAISVNSPYKGWDYLQKALTILSEDTELLNISILIFGSGYNKEIAKSIPFNTRFLGFLSDEYSLIIAYNAADVFVVPSLADNQPTTIMESLCCGTPVVGFDVGGIPDMIDHKNNGYLAKYKDSKNLAEGIKYCIKNKIEGQILPSFKKNEVIKKHIDLINSTFSQINI